MNKIPFSPNTHIFLWDLHGVILEKNLWDWFFMCLRFNRKAELIKNLNKKTLSIAGTFLLECLRLTKKQMVSEELIKAAEQTNNQAFIDLTVKTCSSYKPTPATISLMKELSDLGYAHHLGSNIGKTVFNNCAERFASVFDMFTEATIPFECPQSGRIIKKPYPDFFHAHLKKHNLQPHHIIFIDDKLTNVHAAQAVGMHAIHFKNARDLRQQLVSYRILS